MAIQAMKDAGHQVVEFRGKIKDHHADAAFAQQFMKQLHSVKVDLVFSYDYFPLISMICEMNHIPYAAWVYDCPQYMLLSKTITNNCNHIFCFDGAYAARLKQLGAGNIYHFPLACDMELYDNAKQKNDESDYICDISFVGSLYNGAGNRLLHTELSEYAAGYVEGLLCAQKEICGYNLIADAQTNMPTPPKFLHAFGNIGVIEVFCKMEAKYLSQSDCHIGITGKIKVNVQHKSNCIHPVKQHRGRFCLTKQLYQQSKLVGNQNFLSQANQEPSNTQRSFLPTMGTAIQLPCHIDISDNRACNQLGK